MNTLEVLTGARALVDKGWLQGNWYTVGKTGIVNGACTAGAIRLAANNYEPTKMYETQVALMNCSCGCGSAMLSTHANPTRLSLEAEKVIATVIAERSPSRYAHLSYREIPEWNDTPGRTKVEVLAVFDEAIKRLTPPPPKPVYDAAACVATAVEFGKSKVTYVIPSVPAVSWVPDYVPASLTEKVLVNSA